MHHLHGWLIHHRSEQGRGMTQPNPPPGRVGRRTGSDAVSPLRQCSTGDALRRPLLVAAEEAASLLRKRERRRRRRRQMNRRLGSWGLFGIGRGHVRTLARQANRPEDDFGRQKHAADLNQPERSPIVLRFDSSIGAIQMPAAR